MFCHLYKQDPLTKLLVMLHVAVLHDCYFLFIQALSPAKYVLGISGLGCNSIQHHANRQHNSCAVGRLMGIRGRPNCPPRRRTEAYVLFHCNLVDNICLDDSSNYVKSTKSTYVGKFCQVKDGDWFRLPRYLMHWE